MGQATDGIVFWGVAFPEDDYEVNERIGEIVNGDPDDEASDLYGDGREWLEPLGLVGKVEFVHFCSETAPMWGIAAAGSVVTAHRGWVKSLDLPRDYDVAADSDILKALKALDADVPFDEYGWKLVSYWEL